MGQDGNREERKGKRGGCFGGRGDWGEWEGGEGWTPDCLGYEVMASSSQSLSPVFFNAFILFFFPLFNLLPVFSPFSFHIILRYFLSLLNPFLCHQFSSTLFFFLTTFLRFLLPLYFTLYYVIFYLFFISFHFLYFFFVSPSQFHCSQFQSLSPSLSVSSFPTISSLLLIFSCFTPLASSFLHIPPPPSHSLPCLAWVQLRNSENFGLSCWTRSSRPNTWRGWWKMILLHQSGQRDFFLHSFLPSGQPSRGGPAHHWITIFKFTWLPLEVPPHLP